MVLSLAVTLPGWRALLQEREQDMLRDIGSARLLRVVLIASAGLAGCASTQQPSTASVLTPAAASTSASAGYVLSADEQALECKQLTGRMQIRILEVRDYNERNATTAVSRALQSGVTSLFGGSTAGSDPQAQTAKDRAMLDAYNRQLAAKSCKTYDLDAELRQSDFRVTPAATIAPDKKAPTP